MGWSWIVWVVGILACSPAQARPFAADLVQTRKAAPDSVGRLRVGDDRVRIETPDFPDGFFVSDAPNHASYFARPAARVFMDARQSSWLVQMFVPVDPDHPCRQWRDMAAVSVGAIDPTDRLRCERLDEEMVEGRHVVRYRIRSSADREIFSWVDPDLKFPLKIQWHDGAVATLENIAEGAQPASLFEIPKSFLKFDPQALIGRIKQSDVWVEPPSP